MIKFPALFLFYLFKRATHKKQCEPAKSWSIDGGTAIPVGVGSPEVSAIAFERSERQRLLIQNQSEMLQKAAGCAHASMTV
ncbi:MAG: hypothetical protein WA921_13005 [Ahrensia sp.]